jgi:hypothetical protein
MCLWNIMALQKKTRGGGEALSGDFGDRCGFLAADC